MKATDRFWERHATDGLTSGKQDTRPWEQVDRADHEQRAREVSRRPVLPARTAATRRAEARRKEPSKSEAPDDDARHGPAAATESKSGRRRRRLADGPGFGLQERRRLREVTGRGGSVSTASRSEL